MRVHLVLLPPWSVDSPPAGLAHIAASMKKRGHEVSASDLNIQLYNILDDTQKKKWHSNDDDYWKKELVKNEKILDSFIASLNETESDILGISGCSLSESLLYYVLKKIVADKKIVMIGGDVASNAGIAEKIAGLVDFIIVGEGEDPVCSVADYLAGKIALEKIEGIKFPNNKDHPITICAKKRPIIKEFPDYSVFPLDSYATKELPISFSRGCIKRCAFCEDSRDLAPFRTRRPEDVAEEIEYNMKNHYIRIFSATDLLINGSITFLERLCDIIIERHLHPFWSGQAIIRKEMTLDLLRKMRMAGCTQLFYGVESFSDNVLQKMGKGSDSKMIADVIKATKHAGIVVWINLIVGFPGESEEDVDLTIRHLNELAPFIDYVNSLNICHVFKDTPLSQFPIEFGIQDDRFLLGPDFKEGNSSKEERIRRFRKVYKECVRLNLTPKLSNGKGYI